MMMMTKKNVRLFSLYYQKEHSSYKYNVTKITAMSHAPKLNL